jgi:hypothetical protein
VYTISYEKSTGVRKKSTAVRGVSLNLDASIGGPQRFVKSLLTFQSDWILLEMGLNFLELEYGNQVIFERCLKEFSTAKTVRDLCESWLAHVSYCPDFGETGVGNEQFVPTPISLFPELPTLRAGVFA